MANGTLLISGKFPSHPMNSLSENLNLRSLNIMNNSSTDRRLLSGQGPMRMPSSERSRSATRKQSSVSRESMEMDGSSDDQLPVMRMFQKFVTSAGILVECTHLGCKPVIDEDSPNSGQLPHDWPSFENIMSDILQTQYGSYGWKLGPRDLARKGSELIDQTGEPEAVEVVGMYASILWETEEDHDQ